MRRKWTMFTLGLLLVLSTLISLVACGPQPVATEEVVEEAPEEVAEEAPAEELEPIKVGWFGALTGDWALWGRPAGTARCSRWR